MQTQLADFIKNKRDGKIADEILRKCVHCGFCNATCPTYQLLGDENDGPRGRIYLIKQLLEGKKATVSTLGHLDRCLTCLNCETTCPSGVEYSKLLDIGRKVAEKQIARPKKDLKARRRLRKMLMSGVRFKYMVKTGQLFKSILPASIASKIPIPRAEGKWPTTQHERKMLILDGCVQPTLSPDINATTARVLDKFGITVIREKQVKCCGAVNHHLNAHDEAIQFIKHNIDTWWKHITTGIETIIITASGCGATIKDYPFILRNDLEYAHKARIIIKRCKDIVEVIAAEDYKKIRFDIEPAKKAKKIVWHPPCTLQHGQKITGVVEKILTHCGYQLSPITDSHLCCGSAGTYSILQPELSNQLRDNKLRYLTQTKPDLIVTANIGCQTHLQEKTKTFVQHWIHLLD